VSALWVGGSLVIPILPAGQITLTRDGDDVKIERRFYRRGQIGLPKPPDDVTTFVVPFAAWSRSPLTSS
jgi:hypothetical protein